MTATDTADRSADRTTGAIGTPGAIGDRIERRLHRLAAARPDRTAPLILLAAGTIALGGAMAAWVRHDGSPFAPWLVAALVLVAAGVAVGGRLERRLAPRDAERILLVVIAAGIIGSVLTTLISPKALPIPTRDGTVIGWGDARILLVLAGIVGVSGLSRRPPLGRLHLPVLLVLGLLVLGLWVVATSHWPGIDVFFFERDAGIRLGQLVSPYSGSTTNIYASTRYYPDGFATTERVLIGYQYPPVALLVTSAGQILGDEPRTGIVIAMVVAGAIVGAMRRDPVGRGVTALLLLSPVLPFLLHEAFIEPIVIALLAATVAMARRSPRGAALLLGLFFLTKQYCVVALALVPLLVRAGAPLRETVRMLAIAIGTAALVVLPFLIWDAGGLLHSAVAYVLAIPPRADSLGFGPAITSAIGSVPALLLGALTALAALVALVRAPWTPSGFAAGTGLVLLVLLAFSRASFPNYYLMVVGALCIAIAAARPGDGVPDTIAEPAVGEASTVGSG